jgi:multiple RNA-binding domain-containing protein 1
MAAPAAGADAPGEEASSRLCVKNIPKYLTDKRLKEHFSARGAVTDVKILKTRCGRGAGPGRGVRRGAAAGRGARRRAAAGRRRCAPPRGAGAAWRGGGRTRGAWPCASACRHAAPRGTCARRLAPPLSAAPAAPHPCCAARRRRDGQPRQMAFVGYRTTDEAAAALKYFNNTFIDTCRVTVEVRRAAGGRGRGSKTGGSGIALQAAEGRAAPADASARPPSCLQYARKFRDAAAPRPWSKYSEGSSRHDKLAGAGAGGDAAATAAGGKGAAGGDAGAAASGKGAAGAAGAAAGGKKGAKAAGAGGEGDERLAEFLALMQPRSKARVWSNDELLPGGLLPAAVAGKEKKGRRADAAAPPAKGAQPAKAAAAAGGPGRRSAGGAAEEADGEEAVAFEGDSSDGGDEEVFEVGSPAGGRRGKAGAGAARRGGSEEEESEEEDKEGGGKDAVVVDAGVSDLDYLRARMKSTLDDEEDEEEDEEDDEEEDSEEEGGSGGLGGRESEEQDDEEMAEAGGGGGSEEEEEGEAEEDGEEEDGAAGCGPGLDAAVRGDQTGVGPSGGGAPDDAERQVLETGRLFVRNLAYDTTEADLSEAFGAHGALEEVHLVLDRCGGGREGGVRAAGGAWARCRGKLCASGLRADDASLAPLLSPPQPQGRPRSPRASPM